MKKVILFVLLCSAALLRAEDWTVAGRTYPNITVTKVDADKVHVMYDGGIGSIMLADMPPDLQKRFNYDPKLAKEASQKSEADRQAAVNEIAKEAPPTPAAPVLAAQTPQAMPGQSRTSTVTVDRGAVQAQINSLTSDIAEMQNEITRNDPKEAGHAITSQSGYRDALAQKQQELAQLKAMLAEK